MKAKFIFSLSLVLLTFFAARADLYINEVNSAGKWIEIYNQGDVVVDVSGYTVLRFNNDYSDNIATIPAGTTIAANGFLVLFQTGVGAPIKDAIECLPFGISTDKFWGAELYDTEGEMVDGTFDVGFPQTVTVTEGKSWARATDGGAVIVSLEPTPGMSNTSEPLEPSTLKIFINEVNSTGKWIEIYSDEDNAMDIGGYTVARFNNDNAIAQFAIPAGTTIPANGFVVLYQGNQVLSPVEGAIDCMNFGISSDKFWYVVLKDDDGRIVDNTFNIGYPQTVTVNSGKSWARATDGDAEIVAADPTPGNSNTYVPEVSELKIYINEVNATGKWIEIYNDEDNRVDMGGFTVTRNNNDAVTHVAPLPEGTTIPAKGFIVLYQGGDIVPSPVAGAIDCLPYGISADKFMSAILKDDEGRIIDKMFDIGYPQTVTVSDGQSWARETDGGAFIVALEPTPGEYNDGSSSNETIGSEENVFIFINRGMLILPENTSLVQLYTLSGQLVLSQAGTVSLDMTGLAKGIYVVRLNIAGKAFTQKIALQY